jgi:hypothetical protein
VGSSPGASGSSDSSSSSNDGKSGPLEDLGQWRGHWDGKRLTFTPADAIASNSSIRPKGFIEVPESSVSFTTDEAMVLNSSCPQNLDPANNYFTSGTHQLSNGSQCGDHHLCALVTVQNLSSRIVDRVFAQITSITPGFAGDGASLATVPPGYPLDASMGLWLYGSLTPGGGGGQAEWDFSLPSCDDFTFTVKMMGTVQRSSYQVAGTNSTDWIDACSLPGHSTILQGAGPGSVVSDIPMPFPFTLYDITFDTDTLPAMSISSNGALGFSPITTDNVTLPDASGAASYTIFPFWDALQLGPAGVCYGMTGTTPNRQFVVTWTNADIVSTTAATENMTFSAVLNESSDLIQFLYNRWSSTQATCTAVTAPSRGGGATIGVQGSAVATQYTTQLPVHTATCPGTGYKITLTPTPGNAF